MEVEIQNAITAETLEPGGKKPPAKAKPAIDELPKDGLILAPPSMAKAVIDGKKIMIVKSRSFEIDNKDYVLLSQRKALGVVHVGAKKQINDKEFTALEPKHLITAKLRAQWAEAQPSWAKAPLYAWPIKVVQKFDEAKDTNVKLGPQVVVRDVEVEKLAKPFKSPGGKDAWVKELLKRVPKHKTYVEPYAGSASLFFAKEPSEKEVLADTNPDIIAVFKFLKSGSDEDFKWMRGRKWAWSKEQFATVKKAKPTSLRERAYRYKYLNLFSTRGAGERLESTERSRSYTAKTFLGNLEKYRDRLKSTAIVQGDALKVMQAHDGPDTFQYIDPPWKVLASNQEWKDFDGKSFADAVTKLKSSALISYQGKIELKGFQSKSVTIAQGGIAGDSTQQLYWNYTKKALEETITKIKDVKTYDPSKVTDAVFRDDFRLTLAFYANWKKDPKGFKHNLETIETLLRKILKEAVRRGPEIIRFDPAGMKPSVRSFFLQVARDIKLPQTMLKKVALKPDTDPEDLTDAELKAAHWQLHRMLDKEKLTQTGVKGWSTEDIVNLHALVVDEMFGRKIPHPSPPDNGLDELSADFEQNAAKQPDWHTKPVEKIEKRAREYATINHSGVKLGKEIKIGDVLKYFKTFKFRTPYIYLVGGLANHGKTEGDIDILVNDMEDAPDWQKQIIEFRLGRCLPPELAERLEIHYDRERGPFTNHVELFDLTVERVNEKNEVKEMSLTAGDVEEGDVEKQQARAAPAKLKAQADKAAKSDKLTLGEFFYQPKPTRAAQPEQLQTIENFMSLYKERAEDWLPTVVQKKMDGARHQIHVDGDKVTIFSEDGGDNTDRFPQTIEELKALRVKKLVLDAEIERWDGRQHLPREVAAGYINSKDEPDDSAMITNVFDVLYHGEDGDVHKKSTEERLALLKGLGVKQSTMGVPNLKYRLNAAPGIEVDDLEELERAVRRIRKLPGSEGVVNKQSDAPYTLKAVTPDEWVKFHSATTIGGIVMGREKTKGGAWVYQYGVLPGKEEAEETVEVKGRKLTPVGDTFATKRDFSEGDGILVECETLNIERSPKGLRISAWVPRVIGELDRKADTVDQVRSRASRNLVLQQKDIDEEGKITYRPTRKRVKVEKQEDPYMEIPDEDKTYRYSVQAHWRGRGMHNDLRLELRPKKLLVGWTMNTQIAGVVKEPVTTLKEAKRWSSRENMDKISKINWHTGEWARRPKAGTTKLVRTSILSERKAPEPHAWLDVEGKTRDPEEGKAPPVGGTRKFPGVFDIVDEGTVEWGSMKPWFHEYFFHGGGLNYRMFFRLLKIAPRKAEKSCEACNTVTVGKQIGWVDSEEWTDLCDSCTTEFLEKQGVVLPPAEEQPFKDEAAWLAIYPDDQTPYVLSTDAVKKEWMPPDGVSALPEAVRKQIPKEFQYWTLKGTKARGMRDALIEAVKKKEVELDVEAPYKSTEKASLLDADFVLQEQTWKGPVQVRLGPTRTRYWVRLDIGRKSLLVLDLRRNPLDNEKVATRVDWDRRKGSMKLQGDISPGHYLNPTKATPSFLEVLDKGKAEVMALSDDFIKIKFKGKNLKGLIGVKRSNDEWLWSPSQAAPEVEEKTKSYKFDLHIPIDVVEVQKQADGTELRLVTGVALRPKKIDAQDDWISKEAIRETAHEFLRNYNKETEIGYMHKVFGDNGLEMVESWIPPWNCKIGPKKKKVDAGSWVVTIHIVDDAKWKDVKSGKLTGLSIGGVATVAAS